MSEITIAFIEGALLILIIMVVPLIIYLTNAYKCPQCGRIGQGRELPNPPSNTKLYRCRRCGRIRIENNK